MSASPTVAQTTTLSDASSASVERCGGLVHASDEELAFRAQAGSLPAFADLVRRLEARLFNFLLRRVRIAADAEDLAQETFVRAWQHINRYRAGRGARFSTWLFTIASRLAVDHLRRQRRDRWRQRLMSAWGAPTVECGETRSSLDLPCDGAPLWTLAASVLNNDQHAAMWLRYAEDLSIAEIARVMGKTQVGVRVMLHRARAALLKASKSCDDGRSTLHQDLIVPGGEE